MSIIKTGPSRHSIAPSLNLDFANTKKLDPRIDFTRTTTATYYDGVTHAKAEENLLLYSQELDDSGWGKPGTSVTADAIAAPDGTTTADEIKIISEGNFRSVNRAVSSSQIGSYFTFSVFLKSGNHDFVRVELQGRLNGGFVSNEAAVVIDLTDGSVVITPQGTAAVSDAGNGWYRVSVTGTQSSGTNQLQVFLNFADSSGAANPSPSVPLNSTFYAWGAQLEQRSSLTAYTPTTTQPITNYVPALQTAAAGEARFDHDPITGESLGLLVEEQRTNLIPYSAEFDNAAWTKSASSIQANTIVAPDGTLTGDKFVAGASNAEHYILDVVTGDSNTTNTLTVYVKAGGKSNVSLRLDNSSPNYVRTVFDLSSVSVTNTINNGTATGATGLIEDVGNNWYRCSVTGNPNQVGTTVRAIIYVVDDDSSSTFFTGDGFSGVYIWGAQLEAASLPTSYIATSGSTATRNADSAEMTGTNFSSWYRQDEGTVYAESSVYAVGVPTQLVWNISNVITLRAPQINGTTLRASFGGVFSGALTGATITPNTPLKSTVSWQGLSARLQSGSTGEDITGTTTPVGENLNIGKFSTGSYLNGHLKKLAFYPKRLPNDTLVALTEE